jgi:GAF domain-containing protein
VNEHGQVVPGAGAARSIEQLSLEVERLRRELDGSRFADALKQVMLAGAEVGTIGSRLQHGDLLRSVVETAAAVLDCERGTLFLLDESAGELVSHAATGPEADRLRELRLPLGYGIAGYAAATGQSLAVSNAEDDPRLARDIGDAIGHRPKTVLCVPLLLEDSVVGVFEMLDKASGAQFTPRDMEMLGRFGQLAAIAIDHSRLVADIRHLFRSLLGEIAQGGPAVDPAHRLADLSAESVSHGDELRLAGLVHDLGRRGDDARRLAIDVLGALHEYLASRERTT